uniref:6-bladed beta-propeller n=1 Tax=Amphimedon queenslandica TaxID=400682 RepID=A0A1X7TY24_AMPQE
RGSANGQFQYPRDIAINSQGLVYVADANNHRIQKFSPDGK